MGKGEGRGDGQGRGHGRDQRDARDAEQLGDEPGSVEERVDDGAGAGRDYRRARELLWMAAHDLSAPLAAIRMHVRAKEGAGPSKGPLAESDFRASLARIDKLAAAAQRMLDDVLAVERLKEHPPTARSESLIDAEKVLGEVVAMQAAALERAGCSIFVKRRDGLDRVVGRWNQTSLERLFGNLIQNVVRHAPGAPIEVSFARRAGQLQIRFADGGPGLPVDGGGAGEAFAHSAAGETGHGLGLWIVYRTVAELAGEIVMQTGPGQGLSFDIRLPLEC